MVRYIRIDGERRQMTNAEESAKDADEAAMKVTIDANNAAVVQKVTDKGTGNQKLLDLGLTQAEVDALTGQ